MTRIILKIFGWLLSRFSGSKFKINLLNFLFCQFRIDPLIYSLNNIGILKYQTDKLSGEAFLIKEVLPKFFSKKDYPIIFDVGANIGNYTKNLLDEYPNSLIYSFEPSQVSFSKLNMRFKTDIRVIKENIALGATKKESKLYSYGNDLGSEHASLFSDVLQQIHGAQQIKAQSINVITLDEYCQNHKIGKINFLKIDTEGYELNVLMGAIQMISSNSIDLIQFEFNEMNVFSRVFLKDFYSILSDKYSIYRIDSKRLIPLPYYDTSNEIFKFQNFIAISKRLEENV